MGEHSSDKKKILFVGDYNRADYVSLLKSCKDSIHFTFLNFSSAAEETGSYYTNFGNAIYWKDFNHAYELLRKVNPAKVIFLYIESYHHVALNVACKKLMVPTYLLEHGMRADYAIAFDPDIVPSPKIPFIRKVKTLLSKTSQFSARLKSRLFLHQTISQSTPEDAAFINQYIRTRSKYNFLVTFKKITNPKRLADFYISFSPKVFEIHQVHENLPADQKVHFIGVPYFDELAATAPAVSQKIILFIDQPIAEQGLLGWTMESKKAFTRKIAEICQQHSYSLYIKPHPLQNISPWLEQAKRFNIRLIDDQQLLQCVSSVPLVLGFYSTYLMPLAALPHITLFTLENHPIGKLNVSKPFTDAGVAQPVFNLEELQQLLSRVDEFHEQQLQHKAKFTEDWLYRFDGKSGNRLKEVLDNPPFSQIQAKQYS